MLTLHVMKTTAAALLVAGTVGVSAAGARPAPLDAPAAPPVQVVQASSDGFDWDDAGIGAAAVLGLLGFGSAPLIARGVRR